MLDIEDIRKALPIHLKSAATQNLADMLNQIQLEPEVAEGIRENFISYAGILKDGRYKLETYMNAVAYVTFRMMGYNNQESYARAFPERYAELVAKNASAKEISSYVAMYNKGKLVTAIMEQSMIPVWVMNQDVLQKAINKQVELMSNGKSEMVQHLAAKSLMETLKKPDTKEVNLNIGTVEDKGVEELRGLMINLAKRQQELIADGASTKEIAHQSLVIDGTASHE